MSAEPSLLDRLQAARASGQLIASPFAAPASLEEAYAIAAALTKDQGSVAGWKVGATTIRGQQMLRLSDCFFGRIFLSVVHRADGPVYLGRDGTHAVEPELAVLLARDVPVREEPYTPEEMRRFIDAVAPAVELNRPSYVRPMEAGGLALIADNGVNAGAVLGHAIAGWRETDLAAIKVDLVRDGESVGSGSTASIIGGPLQSVAWLANALPRFGGALTAGQFILTGAMASPIDVQPRQRFTARFEGLEEISILM